MLTMMSGKIRPFVVWQPMHAGRYNYVFGFVSQDSQGIFPKLKIIEKMGSLLNVDISLKFN